MQVQRIQNNPQPQFGNMSLIARNIPKDKVTAPFVSACERAKQILNDAPKSDIIDVKLIIDGENLIPRINTGMADNYSTFFEPSIEPFNPEFLHVKTKRHPYSDIDKWEAGVDYTASYKLGSSTEAAVICRQMRNAATRFEKAALFARVIYESMLRRFEEGTAAAKATAQNMKRFEAVFDEIE